MQRHIVTRQVFDLSHPVKEAAHELQNRISRIFNTELVPRYEKLFDRMADPDVVFRFDKLVLDLEELPPDFTDDELIQRVLSQLEHELSNLISLQRYSDSYNNTEESDVQGVDEMMLLRHFLLTGLFPWWAGNRVGDINQLVAKIKDSGQGERLRSLLLDIGTSSTVRKRMAFQLNNEAIAVIIGILQPAEAEFILSYHREVVRIQSQERVVSAEISTVERAVWLFIFDYLFMLRGNVFNRKEFVKQSLQGIAAHFNVGYNRVLAVFFNALKSFDRIRPTELSTIITELTANEGNKIREEPGSNVPRRFGKGGNMTVSGALELLRYFLLFGSVPVWVERHLQQGELQRIFQSLVKKEPSKIRELILLEGQKEQVRRRLVNTFDENLVKVVVTLIEPANAGFIISYVDEVMPVQQQTDVIKAESAAFKKSIWEFVLEFLIVERGSVFNTLMFLKQNIRQLAARYNISYRSFLTLMLNTMERQLPPRQIVLFELLRTLRQEDEQEKPLADAVNNQADDEDEAFLKAFYSDVYNGAERATIDWQDEGAQAGSILLNGDNALTASARHKPHRANHFSKDEQELIHKVAIRNVLRYWMLNGYFPWWGRAFSGVSPHALFDELRQSAPADALLLLKLAGTNSRAKYRLLYQFPASSVTAVFSLVAGAAGAMEIFLALQKMIVSNPSVRIRDTVTVERLMALVFWNGLIQSDYKWFDKDVYMENTMFSVAEYAGISPDRLKRSLAAAVKDEVNVPKILIDSLLEGTAYLSGSHEDDYFIFLGESSYYVVDYQLFAGQIPGVGTGKAETPDTVRNRQELKKRALYILKYFLEKGKLPSDLKLPQSVDISAVLKQLLVYIATHEQAALRLILEDGNYQPAIAMQLYDAFQRVYTREEEQVSTLLFQYFERDFVRNLVKGGHVKLVESLMHLLTSPHPDSVKLISTILLSRPAIIYLASGAENTVIFQLFDWVNTGWEAGIDVFLHHLHDIMVPAFSDTLEKQAFSRLYREYVLLLLAGKLLHTGRQSFIAGLIRFVANGRNRTLYEIAAVFSMTRETNSSGIALLLADEIARINQKEHTMKDLEKRWDAMDHHALKKLADRGKVGDDESGVSKKEQRTGEEFPEDEPAASIPENEKIYITNAGLVLLHPFLHTYYNRLGMLKEGVFVSDDARNRAVHLLQYLVTGVEQHPEHELVLNKILCGLPLHEPVTLDIVLTEQERTVSKELLNAVIQNWDKMKNSSVENLRASFLMRDGAMSLSGQIWNLKVEQRGYDVLLQTLPWGIGMIKSTWMTETIYTEWI